MRECDLSEDVETTWKCSSEVYYPRRGAWRRVLFGWNCLFLLLTVWHMRLTLRAGQPFPTITLTYTRLYLYWLSLLPIDNVWLLSGRVELMCSCSSVGRLNRSAAVDPRFEVKLKYRMNSSVRGFPTVYMNSCVCWYILQHYWHKSRNTMKPSQLHVLTYLMAKRKKKKKISQKHLFVFGISSFWKQKCLC